MTNKKLTSVIIIIAFVIPPLIMVGIIISHTLNRNFLVATYNRETKELTETWTNFDYVPITYTNSSFPDHMKRLVADSMTGSLLDRDQQGRLVLEELIFFRAYSQGTYAAYRSFRIPPGVSPVWTDSQLGSLDVALTNYLQLPAALGSRSLTPDKKMLAYLVATSGDGTVYSNLFLGVCFDQSKMVVSQYTNSIPEIGSASCLPKNFPKVSGELAKFFGIPDYLSQKELASFIHFQGDSIYEIQKKFGSVIVADSYFFIKARDSASTYPIILRVYWDPKLNRWLPDDLALWGKVITGGYAWPVF